MSARPLRFRDKEMPADRPLVMAIVNRTRDSFYDRGRTFTAEAAFAAVDRAVADGADIVDIGGVRAGAQGERVDAESEAARVVPFVAAVRERHPGLVISVDTWRHEVADRVCAAGADLVNDTWAGADPRLAEVAAEHRVGVVCSHTGGLEPRTDAYRSRYADVVSEVTEELVARAERVVALGVPAEGVLIDPTHDFGKNTWHGLALLRHAGELAATGWPVLMALSNKDFVGETLGTEVTERLEGTLAATAVAAWQGARVFRAHQVRETRRVLDMVASIAGTREPDQVLRGLA
ncbi:dihydropteroate synthase [Saccharopolyspora rhizosphaerae]|uniref:Dihydropteroate synthase n=1 Tax=Saccharopolyspora rhizosphaerae TaxID=2492662 RepID=A0A426JR06_9PSEU|nr:dihydropteroate synthase [Saccharopolyspora rhizosphaerae]RRO15573.1 dihydropteroate synthase [Saccharopolyspora rhizosphaerae]